MDVFTAAEMKAIAVLVRHAAKCCGGGEDTAGAILYTGAFHLLVNGDQAVCDLAAKINHHLPEGTPEDWIRNKQ